MAVHNTNQHRFVLACVCALALYPCYTVAKNLGYTDVSGLGATEFFAVTIQYYVREFFAITKEALSGNF